MKRWKALPKYLFYITPEFLQTWEKFTRLIHLDKRIIDSDLKDPDHIKAVALRNLVTAYVNKYEREFMKEVVHETNPPTN